MKSYKGIKPEISELLNYRYQAKALKLFANQRVNNINAGSSLSKAKGRGMDFDEVRHYQAGDDIRLMHWSLTARLGKPYTKVYHEEKERTVYFVLDQRSTMKFGTRECFKSVKATNTLALMSFGALEAHEKVGGVVFDDNGYNFYPAKQNKTSLVKMFNFIISEEIEYQTKSEGGLATVLKFLYSKIRSNSIVILISDFTDFNSDAQQYLKFLARKNQIINIFTYDPIEKALPTLGLYYFSNGKEKIVLDAANKKQNQIYQDIYSTRYTAIKGFSHKHKIGFIEIATNDDLVKTINHGIVNYAN
ncbi:DUF58 domain-containing protein [Allofrancisella guangzhouensis]|uniref:DUF58 domain-containing protein n=1 Tax=Allofrancisella guangzhouensis TaxID=594679 RepID=A0A0A8E4J5_9GAMM|nr:DUF58 domain-containing protein [Allofrancisella guangzhouensis]AJC48522.1 hypothetical protein SD28_02070 [Allofrancisella guangzhouensis]MBK2027818.1 DUF58 domain-containing protein [Allofrancisella guangzhouensis]MBK2044808.1 DUF58 domain-containing protein [Allofrancisella guangzhouensis]MBK2045740.1 DUF58 domain-containing protein [Allofrancisella guangzhouensis]